MNLFMELINSEDIFENNKLQKLVKKLSALNSKLLIFGLSNSGKSTLGNAVCQSDSRFITLEYEEVLSDKDNTKIIVKSSNLWCVGHQYPNQNQDVSDDYLLGFAEGMNLDLNKWIIIRISK